MDDSFDTKGIQSFSSELEQDTMYVFTYPSRAVLSKQNIIILRVSEAIT